MPRFAPPAKVQDSGNEKEEASEAKRIAEEAAAEAERLRIEEARIATEKAAKEAAEQEEGNMANIATDYFQKR